MPCILEIFQQNHKVTYDSVFAINKTLNAKDGTDLIPKTLLLPMILGRYQHKMVDPISKKKKKKKFNAVLQTYKSSLNY